MMVSNAQDLAAGTNLNPLAVGVTSTSTSLD
jgi:hypothetical protein